jgi:hypothetical protein
VNPGSAYIYVIAVPYAEAVKIGWTIDVDARLSTLQSGSPLPLLVLWQRLVPHAQTVEARLHRRFHTKRVRGEWFDLGPDAARMVSDACEQIAIADRWPKSGVNLRRPGRGRALLALRAAGGEPLTSQEIAARTGLTYGSVRVLLSRLVKRGEARAIAPNSYIAVELCGESETSPDLRKLCNC